MAEGTEDVNMLAGITVDTHDTEDVITDSEGITVDAEKEIVLIKYATHHSQIFSLKAFLTHLPPNLQNLT